MEHVEYVEKISGPVSAHVFELLTPGSKKLAVYLFGDVHFSYDNQCDHCSMSKGCFGVVDFIERVALDAEASGKSLDVFFELPYVPANPGLRTHARSWIDAYFSKNASVGTAFGNALAKLFGRSPQYLGIFSKLYRKFGRQAYDHMFIRDKGKSSKKETGARFHYADARLEPNAMSIIMPMQKPMEWIIDFHKKVNNTAKLGQLLSAFIFSKNFAQDVKALWGPQAPLVEAALSTITLDGTPHKVHKIAKQYHKLPANLKPSVTKYLKDRISRAEHFLSNYCNYNQGVKMLTGDALGELASLKCPSHEMDMFREILSQRTNNYIHEIDFSIMFVACTLLMDAYLLCRMLYYLHRANTEDGSCAIVYAGDAHIQHYADYFVNYMGLSPALCSPLTEGMEEGDVVRCVDVSKRTCSSKNLKTMFPNKAASVSPTTIQRPAVAAVVKSQSKTKNAKGEKGAAGKKTRRRV